MNIIGGIVKPKISPVSIEIAQLMSQSEDSPGEIYVTWDPGLPESNMGDDHSQYIKLNRIAKFHVSFKIKDDVLHLLVLTQKY